MKRFKDWNLSIDVEAVQSSKENESFTVSNDGTFQEEEVIISKKGLLVKGEIPKLSPNQPVYRSEMKEVGLAPLELKDLKFENILGRGSSGVVKKALYVPANVYFAVKIIPLEITEKTRKHILLELKTLHKMNCEHIVSFFDAFYDEGSIYIALEFMDAGSLADQLKKKKQIPEKILGDMACQVIKGLIYLHKTLHLVHRDIKPGNLLLNWKGEVKISDFGVSGQLAHTLSDCVSWVGTVTYMSPERLVGEQHSYNSDIWSLGISLLECAIGYYPFQNSDSSSFGFWEIHHHVVKESPPSLPKDQFSSDFCSFIDLWFIFFLV